ncbi:MAG: single-stranded DNA-binding protein, partial [Dehalococcoidia bacterium]|nr:single-stranded DNA-binding protein [Dehalococcoidia bacterium]
MIVDNIDADLSALIEVIPKPIQDKLLLNKEVNDLLEVVLDLGRLPEARFLNKTELLDVKEVNSKDIDFALSKIGIFGADNRAGLERTLHRISAIRNRSGKIV